MQNGWPACAILGIQIWYIFGPIFGMMSDHFLGYFWATFRVQNRPKMNQNGFQKPSQGATRTKRNDFENCGLVLFFAKVWELRPSQESPKTAEKAPKMPSKGQQEPFKKELDSLPLTLMLTGW